MVVSQTVRILIVRMSALGDVIMASGLIPALRARWPDAHISWLVEPAAAPLLREHPRLDQIIVWPRSEWQKLWVSGQRIQVLRSALALRKQLRAKRFDLAIDAQSLLKSGLWAWCSGAPRRLALKGREPSHWLATETLTLSPALPQEALMGREYRALARHLGAPEAAFQPDLVLRAEARAQAGTALTAAGLAPGQAHAVFCPWTTRPQKHWFETEWQALGAQARAAGLVPVLLGGPAEAEASAVLAARMPGSLSLAGRLPLDASLAVIASARLLVGVDTGLTHAGTALKVPTVALFGSTRPYLDAGLPTTRVLYSGRSCSPCRRRPSCDGRFDCMRDHTAESVWAAAEAVLAAAEPARRRPILPLNPA
ncbi:glycosyltransferase family 9 protein [Piscinibacter sp. Jin2]|uniref:Glycosyltransferase family 9 protein n=1 Tax=Aquariibacter lacus TaxID=2801332 RepID=A0A9X1BRG5_9BURK|nr:glycosyltransferase family 9 protein [Piscinibacter lacus]